MHLQDKDSLHALKKAAEFLPNDADLLSNLGVVLIQAGQLSEAAACRRRSLNIPPSSSMTYNTLGNTLRRLKLSKDAMDSFLHALDIDSNNAQAHHGLGGALIDLGRPDEAAIHFHRALKIKPNYLAAQSNLLFSLNYATKKHTPAHYLSEARKYGTMASKKAVRKFSAWRCTTKPKRLRIGFVSGDFCQHSVGHFLEGLLAHIDFTRIELTAYPTNQKEDELTARIRPCFSTWRSPLGKNIESAADLIQSDGIHILIDVSGHTMDHRLAVFAWKPAPVQMTWLGLPTTTGVAETDWVLGDPYATPEALDNQFSEKVWRMPESYLCLTAPSQAVSIVTLPALSSKYVTFGSFNNLAKVNDSVIAVWARILKSVPNSRLALKTKQFSNLEACKNICQRFASCDITAD